MILCTFIKNPDETFVIRSSKVEQSEKIETWQRGGHTKIAVANANSSAFKGKDGIIVKPLYEYPEDGWIHAKPIPDRLIVSGWKEPSI